MRLGRLQVENFGSYIKLDLDFSDVGLALVSGPTGSGKSTLMDAACWLLYGESSKGGSVDQVRSWQTPHQPTRGTCVVETPSGTISVCRVRGKQSDNDLYWTDSGSDEVRRGKDLKDTQRLLDQRLGSTAALYTMAAYFHEFSPAGQFFTASAKDRRALFERIADTRLPDLLARTSSEKRKSVRDGLKEVDSERSRLSGRLEVTTSAEAECQSRAAAWGDRQAKDIRALQTQSETFEAVKAQKIEALETRSTRWEQEKSLKLDKLIAQIEASEAKIHPESLLTGLAQSAESTRCKSCGGVPEKAAAYLTKLEAAKADNVRYRDKVDALTDALRVVVSEENPFTAQIEAARAQENHHADRISAEASKPNPFTAQLEALKVSVSEAEGALKDVTDKANALEHQVALLSRLYDLSFNLRGEMLRKAVSEIEGATNRYLETYFDAELRVYFSLDADDLEVSIQKSGYDCVYPQLSKGQRQLLKLSFGVSVMKAAANAAGTHFSCLMFDEALDGLDATLKVKAFSLLEELSTEHESVLVIDHASELKEMFSRRYAVTLVGDESRLEECPDV